MDNWQVAARVAELQHLHLAPWQLRLCGIGDYAVDDRVQRHGWRRGSDGIVSLPGPWNPARRLARVALSYGAPHGAELRVEQALEAGQDRPAAIAYAAMGAGQMVCGRSALWLHGIGPATKSSWIRLPEKSGARPRAGTILRYGPADGRLTFVQGLPVVDVPQSFVDIPGARESLTRLQLHHDLSRLLATSHALRKCTPDEVAARLDGPRRLVGAPALRDVIKDVKGELSHSNTERQARRIAVEVAAKYGLAVHPEPFGVELNGRLVGEADIAILQITLDVEVDGPHHYLPEQRDKDTLRDRWMKRANWDVERFPTHLIDLSPKTFAAQLDECIRARLGR